MLNYTEFKAKLVKSVSDEIGKRGMGNIDISTGFTKTPQGMSEHINIKRIGSKVTCSLRIKDVYDDFTQRDDVTLPAIAKHLVDNLETSLREADEYEKMEDHLIDYEWAKSRLALFAISVNSDTKKEYPTIKVGSVELGVRVVVNRNEEGMSTFGITKQVLKAYGVTKKKLFEDARKCAEENFKFSFKPLHEMVGEEKPEGVPESYIVTVENSVSGIGASCIAYSNFLDEVGKLMNGDVIVVPSSIDELILLDAEGLDTTEGLNGVLAYGNSTLPDNKVLSENVMLYHADTGELEIVA